MSLFQRCKWRRAGLLFLVLAVQLLPTISAAFAWEIERPGDDINIKERTDNAYSNGEAGVGIGAAVDDYDEAAAEYDGYDYVALNVSTTANSRLGMTYTWDWQSLWWLPEDELWYRQDRPNAGDDVIFPIDIPQSETYFAVRFYGGFGSAEYQRVYVSTNGFISFDSNSQASPTPSSIPHPARPNALVAAVWSDLSVDSSSSVITGLWAMFSRWYFVVMWKNVLHKASGQRLTFEIVLGNAPEYYPVDTRYSQSRIWLSYYSVSSINTNFAWGIEDQQGYKGLGYLSSGSSLGNLNQETVQFSQYSNSYFLKGLTLNFYDTEPQTEFNIWDDDNGYYLRGYNVRWDTSKPTGPDWGYSFVKALAGTATLLISAFTPPVGWLAAGGFIVETTMVGLDWVEFLAFNQYSGMQMDVYDREDGWQNQAKATALTYDYTVDASLSIIIHWILKTPNNGGHHSLTITATLDYYEYSIIDGHIINKQISTAVNLNAGSDDNNNFDKATPISSGYSASRLYIGKYDASDYFKVDVPQGYRISASASARSGDGTVFYLYLYNPSRNWKYNTGYGSYEYVDYPSDSSGSWYLEVRAYGACHGFYSILVYVYHPGGGGCPILYTFSGTSYVCEGLLDIHNPDCNDMVTDHTLTNTPQRVHGMYLFQLVEHPQTVSHIDQVKLFAVLESGTEIQLPLVSARHSEEGNVLPQLLFSDDWRTDTLGADHNGGVSQSIQLKFLAIPPNIAVTAFIFRIEGYNPFYKV